VQRLIVERLFTAHFLRRVERRQPIYEPARMISQVGLHVSRRRRRSVILRLCEYELEEFDSLVRTYGGVPRSTLVNIALEEFLDSAKEQDFQVCKKHKVNLALRHDKLNELTQLARTYEVHELI
jgi:hypothetical protein